MKKLVLAVVVGVVAAGVFLAPKVMRLFEVPYEHPTGERPELSRELVGEWRDAAFDANGLREALRADVSNFSGDVGASLVLRDDGSFERAELSLVPGVCPGRTARWSRGAWRVEAGELVLDVTERRAASVDCAQAVTPLPSEAGASRRPYRIHQTSLTQRTLLLGADGREASLPFHGR